MAFPQVAATGASTQTSNATAWTIDLTGLGTISSGDLLLFFVGMDGVISSPTLDEGGGLRPWTFIVQTSEGSASLGVAYRVANGSEGSSATFSPAPPSGSEQGAWRVVRISAASWHGTSMPTAASSAATGSDANPDPADCAPGWGTEDILWFAACGNDASRTVSAWPFATAQFSDNSGGGAGASLGTCREENAVASNNAGTFTIAAADGWAAATVAVRPSAALGDDEQIAARTVKPDRVRSLTGASRAGSGMTPACHEQGEVLQA